MAVRRTKNGKWIADVAVGRKLDGGIDRRTRTCGTKAQARKAETELLLIRQQNRGRVSERMTFADFLELVYWPQKQGLRANTVRGYRRDIDLRLMPAFGSMDVGAISRLQIQKMISNCPTRKAAKNARGTLSSILGVAVEMGMIPVNPAGFHYQYPEEAPRRPDLYGEWLTTFAEHKRLLDHVRERHGGGDVERMVVLGLCFGLRKGEVFGLDWENVDLEGRRLSVTQTYTVAKGGASLTPPKTPRARRSVPMTEYACERMRAWGDGSGPVVVGRDLRRMHPNTASNHMRELVLESYDGGEPLPRVTLHSLRHSFATACINSGIEVARVSRWLGHCDVSTTYNRYVKPTLDDLRADALAIDAAYALGR